jgi:D-alanyl-D-alanine carboxypeptidase
MEENLENHINAETSEIRNITYYDKSKEERYAAYKKKRKSLTWEETVTHVNIGLDTKFYTGVHVIKEPGNLKVLVNKYNQLNSDYTPDDLEMIDPCYNSGGLLLRHEARIAFESMCREAYQTKLYLQAISTFRSYIYQNKVYYKNLTPNVSIEDYQKERDKVSARAGHSEHQTGLAADINDLEQTFEDTMEGKWLVANSYRYGFLLRYPKGKEEITGYDYEPWHFRYLGKELAQAVLDSGLTYDEYYIRYLKPEILS